MKYRLLTIMALSSVIFSACSQNVDQKNLENENKKLQQPQSQIHEVEIEDNDQQESTSSTLSEEIKHDNKEEITSSTASKEIKHSDNYRYVTDNEGNQIIIVNKKHGLSSDYAPGENAVAKAQLLKLIADMQQQGFSVSNQYSGYRSYEQQQQLYNDYVSRDGVAAADRYSARPGYSEHQTGLAYDLLDTQGNLLGTANDDGAADWLSKHASDYGFIVRYIPGKEASTGYMAEAWHIRYVGNVAKDIYNSNLSLEEYFNIDGGNQYE